jgi:hypothetical protein
MKKKEKKRKANNLHGKEKLYEFISSRYVQSSNTRNYIKTNATK